MVIVILFDVISVRVLENEIEKGAHNEFCKRLTFKRVYDKRNDLEMSPGEGKEGLIKENRKHVLYKGQQVIVIYIRDHTEVNYIED